jgi:hypothetical protein
VFKFRPSSHSDDYTLLANYRSVKDAVKVQIAVERLLLDMEKNPSKYSVDWSPSDCEVLSFDKKVSCSLYTAGYIEKLEAALNTVEPEALNCYLYYQELQISVTLPKDLTLQSVALVFGADEARAVAWLIKHAGQPKISKTKNNEQLFVWDYAGEEIYNGQFLYLDAKFDINKKGNWEVTRK